MVFTGCAPVPGYEATMGSTKAEILSTISVKKGADTEQIYAEAGELKLLVNEKNATFAVVNTSGQRWDSVPVLNTEEYAGKDLAFNKLQSMVQIHYCNLLNVPSASGSYESCVKAGTAYVSRVNGGVRFDYWYESLGINVPIQVLLRADGVDVSLVTEDVKEENETYVLTSVDVAPFFCASQMGNEGYMLLPDGSGSLVDWNKAADPGVTFRQYIYGRDNAITVATKTANQQDIRLPVFGSQYTANPEQGSVGFTAIVTEGASRTAINAALNVAGSKYNSVYSEFIYREFARIKDVKKLKEVDFVEISHTTIPVQTVRFVLMADQELSYVDMANVYRNYLQIELKVTSKVQSGSAPMVVELFGGVMKQQFVMGFPSDQVVPLTTFADAQNIVKKLKAAGVDQLVINYTEWQKDATGGAIQTGIKPEGNLGGKRALKELLDTCKQEGISIYLDVNATRMVESTWGYTTGYDSASSLRRDPAMQYYYKYNTGIADPLTPSFLLKPNKVLTVAQKLAQGASKYEITGVSSTVLGSALYSDFSKHSITRDHSLYYWNDALKALQESKGNLLLTASNAYALNYATFITDAPMDYSGYLLQSTAIPFYQIVLHGVIPFSVTAMNDASTMRNQFLFAIETGSSLKWNWTAQNQDELVETNYNALTSTHYENWIDQAVAQYKEAQDLLKKVSACTVAEHEQVTADVVRVLWSDGTEVYINYATTAYEADGISVGAQNFAVKGGAA